MSTSNTINGPVLALNQESNLGTSLDQLSPEIYDAFVTSGFFLSKKPLVTNAADFSPIDPGVIENKYYKPGVGFILEIKPDTGERVELISITTP